MKIAKWIPQILLILMFLFAGVMKVITPYDEMLSQMPWAEDFSLTTIRIIGILEILGALGLFLPVLLKKMTVLVPVAAIALALTMVLAMIVHIGRGEPVWNNIVLLLLSVAVVWIRKDLFIADNE